VSPLPNFNAINATNARTQYVRASTDTAAQSLNETVEHSSVKLDVVKDNESKT
jgi:hypothetical protein